MRTLELPASWADGEDVVAHAGLAVLEELLDRS
jgi:hypothetical protein